MIKQILSAAQINHRQGRFVREPEGTYAVYFDDIEVETVDRVPGIAGAPRILRHTARVELYEQKPDPAAEAALEAELDARGLPWTKEDRYWLDDVLRYQVLYETNYTEKS
jgi:hypothetical protein